MATIVEALGAASANAGHVAARPTGLVLSVKRTGGIERLNPTRPTPWYPNLADLLANDWAAGPIAQIVEMLGAVNAG